MHLTHEDKIFLLMLARKGILFYLNHRRIPELSQLEDVPSLNLEYITNIFVTLRKDSQLRGCIGTLNASDPLYKETIKHAINAAIHDSRFSPVSLAEMDAIDISMSVLTKAKPVSSFKSIEIGKHGIILEKSGKSALFLPKVAQEFGWSLTETLSQLSLKANLPANAWQTNCSFSVFESIDFSET